MTSTDESTGSAHQTGIDSQPLPIDTDGTESTIDYVGSLGIESVYLSIEKEWQVAMIFLQIRQ